MGPTTRAKRRNLQVSEQTADDASRSNRSSPDVADASPAGKAQGSEEPEPAAAAPGKKIVFSEDSTSKEALAPKDLPQAATLPGAKKEAVEEQEDSDDEAPEAVSTVRAAAEMKSAAQASQKAAKEQAAAQKRKRQQRDEMFKQQAERKKAADLASKATEAPSDAEKEEEEDKEEASKSLAGIHEGGGGGALGRRRADKLPIPTLLPAELLTDSSDESDGETGPDGAKKGSSSIQRKRRRVAAVENRLTRLDKGPGDEKFGSTVYRVMKKVDEKLAPKSNKASRNTKDALLRRNRTAVKAKKGGFIKRK